MQNNLQQILSQAMAPSGAAPGAAPVPNQSPEQLDPMQQLLYEDTTGRLGEDYSIGDEGSQRRMQNMLTGDPHGALKSIGDQRLQDTMGMDGATPEMIEALTNVLDSRGVHDTAARGGPAEANVPPPGTTSAEKEKSSWFDPFKSLNKALTPAGGVPNPGQPRR